MTRRTPHVFSQMLVGRYLFYGHDALAHCQSRRVERAVAVEAMDFLTSGMAKVIAFLLMVCSPLALPLKLMLIELSSVLEKHRYDDPVGVALVFAPNAFSALVASFVIGLVSWLAVNGGKQFLR